MTGSADSGELMAAVWENRLVSDDAINRCISILRQTLSPDDRTAYIETVVRRGFVSHFPRPAAEPLAMEPAPAEQKQGVSLPCSRLRRKAAALHAMQ